MNKNNKSSSQDVNIEDSRAPLISHLIELRDRLKWAVLFFFVLQKVFDFQGLKNIYFFALYY